MTIHLSGERERAILSLLKAGKFASAEEVIDEALRLIGQLPQDPSETEKPASGEESVDSLDRTKRQLENLRRLGQKLDAMPSAAIADGLSNRDHDAILYAR